MFAEGRNICRRQRCNLGAYERGENCHSSMHALSRSVDNTVLLVQTWPLRLVRLMRLVRLVRQSQRKLRNAPTQKARKQTLTPAKLGRKLRRGPNCPPPFFFPRLSRGPSTSSEEEKCQGPAFHEAHTGGVVSE